MHEGSLSEGLAAIRPNWKGFVRQGLTFGRLIFGPLLPVNPGLMRCPEILFPVRYFLALEGLGSRLAPIGAGLTEAGSRFRWVLPGAGTLGQRRAPRLAWHIKDRPTGLASPRRVRWPGFLPWTIKEAGKTLHATRRDECRGSLSGNDET